MQFGMTIEVTSEQFHHYQITRLGYIRCADHISEEQGGYIGITRKESASRCELDEYCDTCRCPRSEWPVVDVPCRSVVEHVGCKLF